MNRKPHPDDPRVPPVQNVEPHWNEDPEPPSGSHLIPASLFDVKEAKKNAEARAESVVSSKATEITKYVAAADVKWFAASMAGVAVGAVLLVGWFDSRADTKDAGVAAEAHKESESLSRRLDKVEPALQQLALEQARTSVGVDMLLRERGIKPPPPVSLDGGK